MPSILKCRRTTVALFAIACLTGLGLLNNMEVAGAIATVAVGLAGSNAWEGRQRKSQIMNGDNDVNPTT